MIKFDKSKANLEQILIIYIMNEQFYYLGQFTKLNHAGGRKVLSSVKYYTTVRK